jgi:hypothetical protein
VQPSTRLQRRKADLREQEKLRNEAQLSQGMKLLNLQNLLQPQKNLQNPRQNQERQKNELELKNLQKQLWDNGSISEWILRPDTECICYSDEKYKILIWLKQDVSPEAILKEVYWCFRILNFLGAPAGFCVNWWRIPNDRNVAPNTFPTRAEVNGGWARRGLPEVFIFRLEEWDRVLIHECIHAFSWDVMIGSGVKSCLEESLGHGELTEALFEAATELNAEWMWCIIHSSKDDITGEAWIKQTEWQKNQAYIILSRSNNIWTEDTSVFAYYILKAVLALEMTDFLLNWLAGTVNTEQWCTLWNTYKPVFLHRAELSKTTLDKTISMRMTNPIIENFH